MDAKPGELVEFGRKEYLWVRDVKHPEAKVAAMFLIAVREGCLQSLVQTERFPQQPASISRMEMQYFFHAVCKLHAVMGGWEKLPFQVEWVYSQIEEANRPSPRFLLSLCDSLLTMLEEKARSL